MGLYLGVGLFLGGIFGLFFIIRLGVYCVGLSGFLCGDGCLISGSFTWVYFFIIWTVLILDGLIFNESGS